MSRKKNAAVPSDAPEQTEGAATAAEPAQDGGPKEIMVHLLGEVLSMTDTEITISVPSGGSRTFSREFLADTNDLQVGDQVQACFPASYVAAHGLPAKDQPQASEAEQTGAAPEEAPPAGEAAAEDAPEASAEDPAPEQPESFSFRADVEKVYADKYVLTVSNDQGGTASLEFPKDAVSYEGQDATDLQEGYKGIGFAVSFKDAVERHLPEFMGVMAPAPVTPVETALSPDQDEEGGPQAAPNRKRLRSETITVTVHLDPTEREAVGQRMADATAKIEELEEDLDTYRKSINAEIKEAEKDLRAASRLWHQKREEREVNCDVIADYNTGEIVWCERYYPYKEMKRRQMTEKERQLPLPMDTAPTTGPQPEEAAAPAEVPAEAQAEADVVTLYGSCHDDAKDQGKGHIVFTVEYEDANIDYSIPFSQIINLHVETPEAASITLSRAYATEAGMIPAPGDPEYRSCETCKHGHDGEEQLCMLDTALPPCVNLSAWEQAEATPLDTTEERCCGTCARIHDTPEGDEHSPCTECGQDPELPNWTAGTDIPTAGDGQQATAGAVQ